VHHEIASSAAALRATLAPSACPMPARPHIGSKPGHMWMRTQAQAQAQVQVQVHRLACYALGAGACQECTHSGGPRLPACRCLRLGQG